MLATGQTSQLQTRLHAQVSVVCLSSARSVEHFLQPFLSLGYVTLYHITSAASTAAIAGASVAAAGTVVAAAAARAANTVRRMIPHPIIEQVGQQRRRGSVALSRRRLIAALSFWEVHREEFHWLLVVVSKCRQQAGMGARRKENKESTLSNQRCLDVCRKHKGH